MSTIHARYVWRYNQRRNAIHLFEDQGLDGVQSRIPSNIVPSARAQEVNHLDEACVGRELRLSSRMVLGSEYLLSMRGIFTVDYAG